jgi:hypothetical protein
MCRQQRYFHFKKPRQVFHFTARIRHELKKP